MYRGSWCLQIALGLPKGNEKAQSPIKMKITCLLVASVSKHHYHRNIKASAEVFSTAVKMKVSKSIKANEMDISVIQVTSYRNLHDCKYASVYVGAYAHMHTLS